MKIKPEELTDGGYILLDSLSHKELIPFVKTYLKKRTVISVSYTLSNLVIVAIIIYWFWKCCVKAELDFGSAVNYFSYGLAITFGLIPLHEYIHALAYKSQGAENTSYDANFKKFYFMAIADKFVANKKEFQIVALAPFALITASLLLLLVFVGTLWTFTLLSILFMHTALSSGDFGLLSYFEYYKNKDIVTYDDKDNGISYFYEKVKLKKP
jgi:hypothetical protein